MANIFGFCGWRHLRAEPSFHVLQFRSGKLKRSGRGLAFWFHPLSTSIAEVPCSDRDLTFLFHARSKDYQDVTAQGTVTYRIVDPQRIASRFDFALDLETGVYRKQPLEQISQLLVQSAQQHAWAYLASTPVREILAEGVDAIRDRIRGGLSGDAKLEALGLEIISVRVSDISPTSELDKALQAPTHEAIQQQADEAIFQRRALAVEKERAIQENELQNLIELARRKTDLIAQEGGNERQRTEEYAQAKRIESEATAARKRLAAETRAESIRAVEQARVGAEKERMAIYKELPAHVMMGLAAEKAAGALENIEHLNITPDLIGPALAKLAHAGAAALGHGE